MPYGTIICCDAPYPKSVLYHRGYVVGFIALCVGLQTSLAMCFLYSALWSMSILIMIVIGPHIFMFESEDKVKKVYERRFRNNFIFYEYGCVAFYCAVAIYSGISQVDPEIGPWYWTCMSGLSTPDLFEDYCQQQSRGFSVYVIVFACIGVILQCYTVFITLGYNKHLSDLKTREVQADESHVIEDNTHPGANIPYVVADSLPKYGDLFYETDDPSPSYSINPANPFERTSISQSNFSISISETGAPPDYDIISLPDILHHI